MDLQLNDKTVLVTGAGQGLGRAIGLAFARDSLDAHTGGTDDERMRKILAQYPLRRLGRPEDVVPMVLLLASPLSSWTTGQIISVNDGYAMP